MSVLTQKNFKLFESINTRWRDMDAFGHVNNAAFLTYFENARISYFQKWNLNTREESIILASIKVDFLQQLTHPHKLNIGQKVSRVGTTSFDITSAVFNAGEDSPVAQGLATCVCFNYLENKPIPVCPAIINEYDARPTD